MNVTNSQVGMPMSVPEVQVVRQPGLNQLNQLRVRRPVRNQVEMLLRDLDSLIAANFAKIGRVFEMKTAGCSGKSATPTAPD